MLLSIRTSNSRSLYIYVLNEGHLFVLTGRLQTNPIERRISQYQQMFGGRFLVSLSEVHRSESIIKLKTLLKHNFELTSVTVFTSEEQAAII